MVSIEEYEEVFKKGTIVEVSSEDEGLRGSWYTATVLRAISKTTKKILVEYHNLMAEDSKKRASSDHNKPLREFVDAVLVRPIPPREPSKLFRPMEEVDAFHNDGWWEGVVTDSTTSNNVIKYAVFFRCSREQIHFTANDLRLHREWLSADLWDPPFPHPSPSPTTAPTANGNRKRNGGDREDRTNGDHPGGGNKGVSSRNGEVRNNLGSNASKFLRIQDGVGKDANGLGGGRTVSANHSRSNGALSRKLKETNQKTSSKDTLKKVAVLSNGVHKSPRRKLANHAGGK